MSMTKPKGTYDILPNEIKEWVALEEHLRTLSDQYGFKEIRTPIFEHSGVFHRESEHSDMVKKETYNFFDKSNRSLTLRPEQTAGIIRSYVENKLYAQDDLTKLFYIGPNFRYERPQKGRMRQFYQYGVECIGSDDIYTDVEVITLAYRTIESLGLAEVEVVINSLGDEESRTNFINALRVYLTPLKDQLSSDSQIRLTLNPLRILDSKDPSDQALLQNAPVISDYLTKESKIRFEAIVALLKDLQIKVVINPKLVRGLDYYAHTVFEIQTVMKDFGAQNALGGGGRYQNLVAEMGGPQLSGIGFAFGMERLLIALSNQNIKLDQSKPMIGYLLYFDDQSKRFAYGVLNMLRNENLNVQMSYTNKKFNTQLKNALKEDPKYLLIIGENEVKTNSVMLKNVKDQSQDLVSVKNLTKVLKKG